MYSLNRKTYLDVGQISIFMQIKFAAQGTNEHQAFFYGSPWGLRHDLQVVSLHSRSNPTHSRISPCSSNRSLWAHCPCTTSKQNKWLKDQKNRKDVWISYHSTSLHRTRCNHRIRKVRKDLQDHLVQPSTYHQSEYHWLATIAIRREH